MPLTFRIYPKRNLVYVHCTGQVTVGETRQAFGEYSVHDDFKPGQTQLVDLTDVTGFERDFTAIMALQAMQTDVYLASDTRPYLLFVAPNELTRAMAMAALRSWQDLDGVVPLVLSSLSQALEVLSLPDLKVDGPRESVR